MAANHKATYKRAERQIESLIRQMGRTGETPARLRKLHSLEKRRDLALERWARTEAYKPISNPTRAGKLNRWVSGSAFRVRRQGGRLLVDIKRNAKQRRRNSATERRKKETKVERRVRRALKRFVRGR